MVLRASISASGFWRVARYSAVCIAIGALVQGCGGGGESAEAQQSAPPPPAGTTNHAPTISGTSIAQVTVGQAYSFKPQAADADGDTLTFSITNKPAWASFNSSTGELSGTPMAAQAGLSSSITINVSDGKATASLSPFTLTVAAVATNRSVTVSWLPPTTHTDGTALSDLAGYRIRYGKTQGAFDNVVNVSNPGLSTYVIDNLTSGTTYYFVVTAYDSAGNESDFSNIASKPIT